MNLAPLPLSLRQMQYVVAVADALSFGRAAALCRVAQPSLSQQVALVEESLGVRLFERDRRRVVVTAAGRLVVTQARAVLVGAEEMVEAARRLADPLSGTLRLGLIPTVGPYLLPEVAPRLRQDFPRLVFVWVEEKTPVLVERLSRAELDGAILALEAEVGDPGRVVLGKDPFLFAAAPGHPLSRSTRPLHADKLEGEQVLLLDDGHCFREQAMAYCTRAGAQESAYRATSLATLVQMAAGGSGVTLLPGLAVSLENRHGALTVRPFSSPAPYRTLALVWRRGTAVEAALKAVGASLREAYAVLEGRGASGAVSR
jgi:LysR family hydrogen peroxide-inducible transcriptional activator